MLTFLCQSIDTLHRFPKSIVTSSSFSSIASCNLSTSKIFSARFTSIISDSDREWWDGIIIYIGRNVIISIIICRGVLGELSLLRPNIPSLVQFGTDRIVRISSFQYCVASLSSSISVHIAVRTVLISNSIVPLTHGAWASICVWDMVPRAPLY